MAHKTHTQGDSEDMRKIRGTTLINGIYYLNLRYPTELVEAGLVAKTHEKRSLRTRDFQEARARAAKEEALHWIKVDQLKAQITQSEASDAPPPSRHLKDLTKAQRRDLVLNWFIQMEHSAERSREEFHRLDEFERKERLYDQRIELNHHTSRSEGEEIDWNSWIMRKLKEEGIEANHEDLDPEMVRFFRRAAIEVEWRTTQAMEGKEYEFSDPEFKEVKVYTSRSEKGNDRSHTLADLCAEFLDAKEKRGRSPKTMLKIRQAVRVATECFGEKTPLTQLESLEFESGKRLVDFLSRIPSQAHQRYEGIPLAKAAALEAKNLHPKFIGPKSQDDLFTTIKAIFSMGRDFRWIRHNPLDGCNAFLPKVEKRPRQTFTGEELTRILSSDAFLRQRTPENRLDKEGRFWVVLLCLFHGMRLNEAASLLIADVKQEEGIWFIDLTEFDREGNRVKRLKTATSPRRIPIHKDLIAIGFLDYLGRQNFRDPDEQLFPDLKPDSTDNFGASVSKWFSRLRTNTIGKPRYPGDKSIHSFRHAVADAIREITDSDEILYAIGGWGINRQGNSSRRYGRGSLVRLKDVVDKIQFDGFDPTFLR